ncbi:iron dicitrate transport regulator FecR [Pseudomonas gingeri NCPPB 3146 = LMG 5327]|uniref:FecR domain-containing protein n=5 Tax=Pseudomonas gingeri TaxID=117681 RepID=A0A7Y7Y2C2_9PSED|nr:FecR domain-containing protein [Pseudomonas gingeri]NWC16667.1 FecR domain-containing protein [Pseudomonas gingeri]PNQ92634.1 iron dicitrate transport regulator FecR [Pseudomonas gingeri NCPPB 3146 = LMG 5327]
MTRVTDIEFAEDSIDAQAASWFARNRNAQDQAADKAFEAWRATPAHARAYAEFEALWADLAELQQLNRAVPLAPRRPSPWRPALAVAAALVCAVLTTSLGAPNTPYRHQVAAHAEGTRTLKLPDGSTLYVNANTRLRINFRALQRDIYLDQGQLYLEVAADKERPLWVHAGNARVRVVGTAFDVRRGQKQLVVSVAHGQVAFEPEGDPNNTTLLEARQRGIYDYAKGAVQQQALSAEEIADWRSGHLTFRNRELASLIDELNLYRGKPVQLADGPLAHYKVSGSLDAKDPDALLEALPALIPVKTVGLDDGEVRIESRK